MTTFYRVDGGRITFGEYWHMAPDPLSFLVAAGRKLFGVPFRFEFAIPRPDRLFLVEFEEFPDLAQYEMRPSIRAAEKAGLRLIFCHRLALPEPNRLGAAALLLDESNTTCQMIVFGRHGTQTELRLACVSRFADDSLATTTTMKRTMNPLPGNSVERHPDANAVTIYRRHLEHLARLDVQGMVPMKLKPDRLHEFVLDCELKYVDHHIARGVFVPMTEEELDAVSEP